MGPNKQVRTQQSRASGAVCLWSYGRFCGPRGGLVVPSGPQGSQGSPRGSHGRARGSPGLQGRAQGIPAIPGGSGDVLGVPGMLFIKMSP